MKISDTPANMHLNRVNKHANATKATATENVAAQKVDKPSTSEGINRWFSLIGINNSYSINKNLTLDEKVTRKQKLAEHRKVTNLESILNKAIDFCLDDSKSEEIDPDWFFNFIKMAEDIHSQPMQKLWGQIFAVESNKPGSFSLKTLNILKNLTQKDALIFRHAVNLASRSKGDAHPKLILGYYRKKSILSFFSPHTEHQLNLAQFGLSYPKLLTLMDLGLIHQSEIESGELPVQEKEEWRVSGHSISFSAKYSGVTWVYFKFTSTGAELSKLVNSQRQEHYLTALKDSLSHVFTIESVN